MRSTNLLCPLAGTLCALALLPSAVSAQVLVFDLKTDWSDTTNPNGAWTYAAGGIVNSSSSPSPLGSVVRGSDPWSTPQVSWGDLPGWFRSNGTEQFAHDWQAGDIIAHSGEIAVIWTSPGTGTVDITAGIWATRDIGRINYAALLAVNPGLDFLGDAFVGAGQALSSRENPAIVSAENYPVVAGQQIVLEIPSYDVGDYAGVNLTIEFTPVPEPEHWAALSGLALAAFGVRQRIRRHSAQ
jgi:hypothetical protein